MGTGARLHGAVLAGLIATSGASAKDLPRGRADHRATGCEQFGAGFIKVDGTDSCVKVSGAVRAETSIISSGGSAAASRAR